MNIQLSTYKSLHTGKESVIITASYTVEETTEFPEEELFRAHVAAKTLLASGIIPAKPSSADAKTGE